MTLVEIAHELLYQQDSRFTKPRSFDVLLACGKPFHLVVRWGPAAIYLQHHLVPACSL